MTKHKTQHTLGPTINNITPVDRIVFLKVVFASGHYKQQLIV